MKHGILISILLFTLGCKETDNTQVQATTGAAGNPGQNGLDGASCIATQTTNGVQFNCGSSTAVIKNGINGVGSVGPKGDQGQSIVGPMGPSGAVGPIGKTGDKGATGPQGTAGANGKDGASCSVLKIHDISESDNCVSLGDGVYVTYKGDKVDFYNTNTCDYKNSSMYCKDVDSKYGKSEDICWIGKKQFTIVRHDDTMKIYELNFN